MGITGVSDGKIHFITKWGMQLYTGSVDVNTTNATINMTEFCSITKSRVYIKGEYLDLSDFVNQGMGTMTARCSSPSPATTASSTAASLWSST